MKRHPGFGVDSTQSPNVQSSPPVVSSRRSAVDQLRVAVEEGPAGPILITGEPGAGKTWLTSVLACDLPPFWRPVKVDLAEAMDALDLLTLIAQPLGATLTDRIGSSRVELSAVLEDEFADGRHWLLVVDEAHRGSRSVWGEIQAIVNQLGRPGGFSALVVAGETELARELSGRCHGGFASSLKAHLHLMPLDLDEARELLGLTESRDVAIERALEELHRDAGGNPARLLQFVQSRPALFSQSPRHSSIPSSGSSTTASRGLPSFGLSVLNDPPEEPGPDSVPEDSADVEEPGFRRSVAPPLIPSKPPIRVEEGLVEVGWEGDLESESEPPVIATLSHLGPDARSPDTSLPSVEVVDDRYAALQAWNEWTRNQERLDDARVMNQASRTNASHENEATQEPPLEDQPETALVPSEPPASAGVRAEAQHEFAPV